MKFNSKRLIVVLSLILCVVMAFAACTTGDDTGKTNDTESVTLKPDNKEDNVAMLVKLINEAKLPAGTENELDAAQLTEIIKTLGEYVGEGNLNFEENGEKESAYIGIKNGVICMVDGESTQYMVLKNDKLLSVSKDEDDKWFAGVIADLNSILPGQGTEIPGMPEIDLSKVKLPEIKAEMITVDGNKYVISKDYIKSAVSSVITEFAKLTVPEGTSSIDAEAQINAMKSMIETYIDAFNPELYVNIESEVILGGGLSVNIEGANAEDVLGINKLQASIEVGVSGNNLESLKVKFVYRETADSKLYENSVDMKVMYAENNVSGLELKADINLGGLTMSTLTDDDDMPTGVIKADVSVKADVKLDLTKKTVGDELLSVNVSAEQSNFKAYSYNEDYELVLDENNTAEISKNKSSVKANAKAVAAENGFSFEFNCDTDMGGVKDNVKLSGTFVNGSAPNFKALPADAESAVNKAISENN